ncbi:hypothetical protein [Marinomonas shanghaiensis]|uniref:hypothetical protein n=1 Tax=Marinomonas shanghaiensis TaxID=2202418 RepID=UPI000DB90CC2|nr:hypothetical protein [Marinomonas shanghaiensis]
MIDYKKQTKLYREKNQIRLNEVGAYRQFLTVGGTGGYNFMRFWLVCICVFLLAGCVAPNGVEKSEPDEPVSEKWNPRIIHKVIAVTKTKTHSQGICSDAIGTISFLYENIAGQLVGTFQHKYLVSGKINSAGFISGGFAYSDVSVVNFTGQLTADGETAKGTWKDIYNCEGSWFSQKISY